MMLTSLLTFVGFEVFKMLFMQFAMLRRLHQFSLDSKKPRFNFVKGSAEMERDLTKLQVRFIPVWIALTVVCILTGLAGVLIPGAAFVLGIIES